MNAWQVILGLFVVFLVLVVMYIGARYAVFLLDKRFRDQEPARPAAVTLASSMPSQDWWDQLQALRSSVENQLLTMQGYAATAEQAYRNARAADERHRKRIAQLGDVDDEESLPAAPQGRVAALGGWEEGTAPAAQATPNGRGLSPMEQLMEQRRARGNG